MRGGYKVVIPAIVVLGIALGLLFIQSRYREEPTESQRETVGELPADQQAYYGTYGIREPEKRLQALQKFLVDFPESDRIHSAYGEIFKLIIEIWPEDRQKMLAASAAADAIEDFLERSYGYRVYC